ncbi:CHAT domain-containing protein [Catellatospora sp. NPDC049111]|uniref:CHAT domain-containing protein n=1 Tax=Catellatospora sp. NPDC049111 TaxID=3155271 RepID=UPI0033FC8A9C
MPWRDSRRGRQRLSILWGALLITVVVVVSGGEFLWLTRDGGDQGWRFWGAIWVSASVVITSVLLGLVLLGSYRPRPWSEWTIAIGLGVGTGYFALTMAVPLSGMPAALPLAAGVAVAGTVVIRRDLSRRIRSMLENNVRTLDDEEHAERAIVDSEAILARPGLSLKSRRNAELNLARGLVARSLHGGRPDAIVRATDILRRWLNDPGLDAQQAMAAAQELVQAMSRKADILGDLTGYAEALDLLAAVAGRMPADNQAEIFVRRARMLYFLTLAGRADSAVERASMADAAVTEARAAVEVTPGYRSLRPGLYIDLAVCLNIRMKDLDDLDEAEDWCRKAQRLTRWRRRDRAAVDVVLADLLLSGTQELRNLDPDGYDSDIRQLVIEGVIEAIWLSIRAIRTTDGYRRFQARWTLARALTRANGYTDGPADELVADAWREAADDAARYSLVSMLEVGAGWMGWATTTGNPGVCVAACRQLMRVVPEIVSLRYLPEERERVLAQVQEITAEAGYWLLLAGHPREAVTALELGRAVAASDAIALGRADVAHELARRGRSDLSQRFPHALAVLRGTVGAPVDPYVHPAQRAGADLALVRRELGEFDVHYATVAAAAADGPLVYLAATEEYGYAIIVEHADAEPTSMVLGSFSHSRLRERADRFYAAPGPDQSQREIVTALLRWLWENGIAELTARLPAGAMVTLVPMGVFALLPVHAAGGPARPGLAAADWNFMLDRVQVRYAPNARILTEARRRAVDCERAPLTLLAMDAPDAISAKPLRYTRHELDFIMKCWEDTGGSGARLEDATSSAVLRALPSHSVWHWACHAVSRPDDVGRSALHLVGGQLYLADLLRVPPSPRRMAVLSACDSHRVGRLLPDEAVSLPTALLQAGVAGVVATQWPAHDSATAFLVAKFYDLWRRHGMAPSVALNTAQQWLRRADAIQLNELLPGIHTLPYDPDRSSEAIRLWERERPYDHPFRWALYAFTGA